MKVIALRPCAYPETAVSYTCIMAECIMRLFKLWTIFSRQCPRSTLNPKALTICLDVWSENCQRLNLLCLLMLGDLWDFVTGPIDEKGLTKQPWVFMSPVGIVWEGNINKGGMAIIAKHRWGNNFAAGILALHTWKVWCLQYSIHIWYLQSRLNYKSYASKANLALKSLQEYWASVVVSSDTQRQKVFVHKNMQI